MTRITRRRMAAFVAGVPLAAACGAPPSQTASAAPPATGPATPSPPAAPQVQLTAAEQQMIDDMAAEFELQDNWQGYGADVTPTTSPPEVLRKGMSATVSDTYMRLRKGEDYFHWPDDKDSIDYHHIIAMGATVKTATGSASTALDETAFDLTPAVLKRIAAANSFDIPSGAGARKVVFGLRGCMIDGDGGRAMGPSVRLKEAMPDHNHYRCVIGVWDVANGKLAAFKGSTVPLEVHLAVYQRWLVERAMDPKNPTWNLSACMIPQGLHTKKVETMTMGSGIVCPVTLKQLSAMPVLRERDPTKSTLSLESTWEPPAPEPGYNKCHIHASINAKNGNPDYQFSSCGCQTIDGWYVDGKAKGEIDQFNAAMAFENANGLFKSKDNGVVFQFMLVTGREARLHAAGADEKAMRRVRIGSSTKAADDVIVKLNKLVGAGEDKKTFDHDSMLKLIKVQSDKKRYDGVKPDGIFGPVTAASKQFGDVVFPT